MVFMIIMFSFMINAMEVLAFQLELSQKVICHIKALTAHQSNNPLAKITFCKSGGNWAESSKGLISNFIKTALEGFITTKIITSTIIRINSVEDRLIKNSQLHCQFDGLNNTKKCHNSKGP